MCLALYKPAGVEVNWSALKEGMSSNRDGAGFAVVSNGQLIVEKGFFVYEDFRKALEPFAECAAMVHFRMATHGDKNKSNCHPFDLRDFPIPEGKEDKERTAVAVIHNGIFYDAASDQKQWSDTWHVCRDILHPIWTDHDKAFGRPEIVALGDKFVGTGNKLVFLYADGEFAIWGEKNGHWNAGIWYSNHSYEDYRWSDPRYTGRASTVHWEKTTTMVNGKAVTSYKPSTKVSNYKPLKDWDSLDETDWKKTRDEWEDEGSPAWSLEDKKRYGTDDLLSQEEAIVAKMTGPLDEEEDLDAENSDEAGYKFDLDNDLSEGNWQLVEMLRGCGYRDSEIVEIWEENGKDGFLSELSETYNCETDEVQEWADEELRKMHEESRDGEYLKLMGS